MPRNPKIEILQSKNGKDYYFHVEAGNYKIQGDGGQMFPTPGQALRAAKAFQRNVAKAEIKPFKKGGKNDQ